MLTGLTDGVGLTVMVKVIGVPGQPFAVGVTLIVATTAVPPVLVAVNTGILPVPLAASPMLAALLVQAKVVPVTDPPKVIAEVDEPLQYDTLLTCVAVGVGFTLMVKTSGVPEHPFATGVTVIVAVTGAVPVFVAVNDEIFPVPLAPSPIDVALLVQLNTVPNTGPDKLIAGTVD